MNTKYKAMPEKEDYIPQPGDTYRLNSSGEILLVLDKDTGNLTPRGADEDDPYLVYLKTGQVTWERLESIKTRYTKVIPEGGEAIFVKE